MRRPDALSETDVVSPVSFFPGRNLKREDDETMTGIERKVKWK